MFILICNGRGGDAECTGHALPLLRVVIALYANLQMLVDTAVFSRVHFILLQLYINANS